MKLDYTKMVAVALGSKVQVNRWSVALMASSIEHSIVQPCGEINQAKAGYWEIWANENDVEPGRFAMRTVRRDDDSLLW